MTRLPSSLRSLSLPEKSKHGMGVHWKRNLLLVLVATAVLSSAVGAGVVLFLERRRAAEWEVLLEAAETVDQRFVGQFDRDEALESSIDGLVSGLGDRWSYYLSADEVSDYENAMQNRFVGIGVTVTKAENAGMHIEEVYRDSGAEDAGLVPGDEIYAADGVNLLPLTLEEAKAFVVGEEGTSVLLSILHENGQLEKISVERRSVFLDPVSAKMIGSVGYVVIENFDDGAAQSFCKSVDELLEAGAKALLFDVRFNGGGYVREMTQMLDYLLPEGVIFIHGDAEGHNDVTTSDAAHVDIPMAVLVNSDSYSAAEYFAALLQTMGVPVIGEHTVGKGYSQQAIYLSDGSALILSTKKYYLPDGSSLAGIGIAPDYIVELAGDQRTLLYYDQLSVEEDLQLQTALQVLSDIHLNGG